METLSGVFGLLSFLVDVKRTACITGKVGISLPRPLPFVVLDPMDVGREGVEALDKFFALGAVFGVAAEVPSFVLLS